MKQRSIILLVAGVGVAVGVATAVEFRWNASHLSKEDGNPASQEGWARYFPKEGTYQGGRAFDYSDTNVVVGAVHNIFVGQIEELDKRQELEDGNQYAFYGVRPIYDVKGNLDGKVTMILPDWGRTDDPLPPEGSYVLFLARYLPDKQVYVTYYGEMWHRVLSSDTILSDEEVIDLAREDIIVNEFEEAYPYEVTGVGDPDLKHSYNAYVTRCLDASGELIDDTVQVSRERKGLPKVDCVTPLASEDRLTPGPTTTPTPSPFSIPEGFRPPPVLDPNKTPEPTLKPPPPLPAL